MTGLASTTALGFRQPRISAELLDAASGTLLRYRIMAFATGVALACATTALIMKALGVPHMEPETGYMWMVHGWLYLIYVIATGALGIRLRWPWLRIGLIMVAGTIPTLSFVAEHIVTRAARSAAA